MIILRILQNQRTKIYRRNHCNIIGSVAIYAVTLNLNILKVYLVTFKSSDLFVYSITSGDMINDDVSSGVLILKYYYIYYKSNMRIKKQQVPW